MNIVVLDGLTSFSDYVQWDVLAEFGDLTVYDRTPPEKVIERMVDADAVLVNGTVLSREILQQLPRLKYIGLLITGTNLVDVVAARERGLVVTSVPDYATQSVAQMAIAHLLNLTQRVGSLAGRVRGGGWTESVEEAFNGKPLVELTGLVMGILGFGRIGRATAEMARAFGMRILAADPHPPETSTAVRFVELDTLFRESDVVSLHCPLTEANHELVNRRRLALMKPTAYLINTGRGQLIDEAALAEALAAGRIAGAGLDVLSEEPPSPDHPLLAAKNCFVTPHMAAVTRAAMDRQLETAVANLRSFLDGHPRNVVG